MGTATAPDPTHSGTGVGDSDPANYFGDSPTAVTFASVSATQTTKGVLVRWRTGTEADLLGFHVYRSRGGSWQRLSRSLDRGERLRLRALVPLPRPAGETRQRLPLPDQGGEPGRDGGLVRAGARDVVRLDNSTTGRPWSRGAEGADATAYPRYAEVAPHAAKLGWPPIFDAAVDLLVRGLEERVRCFGHDAGADDRG